jgi:predicted GIY-YIG superfamily endonuclease
MKSGVYTITNIINNKIYVGSTNNFVRRFNDHKKELINNIHKNNYLKIYYKKHVKNNFIF